MWQTAISSLECHAARNGSDADGPKYLLGHHKVFKYKSTTMFKIIAIVVYPDHIMLINCLDKILSLVNPK